LVSLLTTEVADLKKTGTLKVNAVSFDGQRPRSRGHTPYPSNRQPRSGNSSQDRSRNDRNRSRSNSQHSTRKLINLIYDQKQNDVAQSVRRCYECSSTQHLARDCPERDRRYEREGRPRYSRYPSRERYSYTRYRTPSRDRYRYRGESRDRYYSRDRSYDRVDRNNNENIRRDRDYSRDRREWERQRYSQRSPQVSNGQHAATADKVGTPTNNMSENK
jgi:hypothetical protein